MFTPSEKQQAIFDWGTNGSGSLIVNAVAGSGKTTTLVEFLRRLPKSTGFVQPSVLFLAFNKTIAETLRAKCPPGVLCSTFHALGLKALKSSGRFDPRTAASRDFVQGGKLRKRLYNALGDSPDVQDAVRLGGLARAVPVLPDDMDDKFFKDIIARFDFSFEEERATIAAVRQAIALCVKDLSCIDFDEMLYLPVLWDAPFDEQDWVFVDESQDTNTIQLEILTRLSTPTTRLVAVGDRNQAIYGFRGANSEAMDLLKNRFKCAELPLDVSYRCSQAVVREAQKVLGQQENPQH